MRRILWTAGLALIGFWGGWYAQGYPLNVAILAIFTLWGACIGFGLGSIFSERRSTRRVMYWAATFGLIGPAPAFALPLTSVAARLLVGALGGIVLGTLFGILQAWVTHRTNVREAWR
jgi:hypothetical protein